MAVVSALAAAACGGDSGAGGSANTETGIGNLGVLGLEPASGAIQVPVDARFEIVFDGSLDGEMLNEEHFTLTPLEQPEAPPIPGLFSTHQGGRVVVFQPSAPLAKATDYRLRLQPTLCDASFRTLDRTIDVDFRTFDDTPPSVVATSLSSGQSGVSRHPSIVVTVDEVLRDSSLLPAITLKDTWGRAFELSVTAVGTKVTIAPLQDLPGSTTYVLTLRGGHGGVTDRAGNALASSFALRFTTEVDTRAPQLVASDPEDQAQGVSPRARLHFRFDESMDETSYEPSALRLVDAFLNPLPFALSASRDKRTLILQPASALRAGEAYSVRFRSGATALCDCSGISLGEDIEVSFTAGSDDRGPGVVAARPAAGARGVSPNAVIEITLDEPVRAQSVSGASVGLWDGEQPIGAAVSLDPGLRLLRILPDQQLAPSRTYTVRLRAGWDGLLDQAGNPMDGDWTLGFTTSGSSRLPAFSVTPAEGSTSVATTSRIVVLASEPLQAESVDSMTVSIKDGDGDVVPGSLALERGSRAIVFRPSVGLPRGERLRVRVVGGPDGVRAQTGNWASADTLVSFQVGFQGDALAPELDLTVNRIPRAHRQGLVLPRFGFTIDTVSFDSGQPAIDPSSLVLTITGAGQVPSPDEIFARTIFTGSETSTQLDTGLALLPGTYTLTAAASDLSGNPAPVATFEFSVDDATTERRPFERTQIVWVQFDTDREGRGKGDGKADFDQDLEDLGLLAPGDPIGRNAWLRRTVIDGILAVANDLFQRTPDGSPRQGSVAMRLVARQPCRAAHMKMAVGGYDPEGRPGRKFGDASTGILGRAFFDYRNSVPNENNAGTSPGLGVFVGELVLYQGRLYLDLWPHYLTSFGRTFKGLSPHMGGKPAGTHALDRTVLATGFAYDKATPEERARHDEILAAADDLASAIGIILAHEIGHSVGLVAEGRPSRGLHGDQSLHNATTSISDVMGAVVGYETLISVKFAFRPINLAYLRERILVK